jgi:GNAT superfamily N-acetyltransferase
VSRNESFKIFPLTPDRWPDVEKLFGERGACGGCWCMWWRLARSDFEKQKGSGNQRAFQKIVKHGPPPGLVAYADGQLVAWCALAPRESYPALGRSRILKPVDDRPVWSVTCLFIAKAFRKRGVSVRLLSAAADYAKRQGAEIIEGYPVEPRSGPMADVFVFTGLASAFRKAGYEEAARRSKTRPIMRRYLR